MDLNDITLIAFELLDILIFQSLPRIGKNRFSLSSITSALERLIVVLNKTTWER